MEIRFSFSSFAVIRIAGRVALLVNKNQLNEKGRIVLTLPGGVYAIDPISERLFAKYGARFIRKTPLSQQQSPYPMTDLRFFGPEGHAEALCGVFEDRLAVNPDTVVRELREELVNETHTLRQRDLRRFQAVTFMHTARERSKTQRSGESNADTMRSMSFFDVSLMPQAAARVARMAHRRPLYRRFAARLLGRYAGAYVYLATEDEIRAGHTESGAEIAAITRLMFKTEG